MSQLRTALSLYYDDKNIYPICGVWDSDEEDFGATVACYNGVFDQALTSGSRPYIGKIPTDPKNRENKTAAQGGSDTYIYCYVSAPDGSEYALVYTYQRRRPASNKGLVVGTRRPSRVRID